MKAYVGMSAGFHDAGVSVIDSDGNILFAGHAERYSKIKNDPNLNSDIIDEAYDYALGAGSSVEIAWYERPWVKKTRELYSGQYRDAFSLDNLPKNQLKKLNLGHSKIRYHPHHLSHAAAGFQTSPFDEAVCVVADAIGEWDTLSVWKAYYDSHGYAKYKKLKSLKYPESFGLFYSAMTEAVGLRPNSDEYILMAMAAKCEGDIYKSNGLTDKFDLVLKKYIDFCQTDWIKGNHHIGFSDQIKEQVKRDPFYYAWFAQEYLTEKMKRIIMQAMEVANTDNVVLGGGVALNCSANQRYIFGSDINMWIMPNPGDCGSSLGAAALSYGKKLNWVSPYLGTDIKGDYPVLQAVSRLACGEPVGIANGRAEFGPRALGNRSLFMDPRPQNAQDKMNKIKKRQNFRPFAPVIRMERFDDFFSMSNEKDQICLDYMQYTVYCFRRDIIPGVVHTNKTSRVQVVTEQSHPGLYDLLLAWEGFTDCPVLMNTSLNIKDEPIVNDEQDAQRFEKKYGVKVFCRNE